MFLPSFHRERALLALISAGLAPLVVACVDGELTEAPMSPAAETGLAADGNPLADGNTEGLDSLVSPTRDRVALTISTTDPLWPNADVELTIKGVAREPIDSGEVALTLPTKAMMGHTGKGRPDLPVKASWVLPAMGAGDTWSETFTVPGAAAGYYQVAVGAHTHGPDGGPYLFDGVLRSAWMFVSETNGRLTRMVPGGVHLVPRDGGTVRSTSRPDTSKTSWHPDSAYLSVVYVFWDGGGRGQGR